MSIYFILMVLDNAPLECHQISVLFSARPEGSGSWQCTVIAPPPRPTTPRSMADSSLDSTVRGWSVIFVGRQAKHGMWETVANPPAERPDVGGRANRLRACGPLTFSFLPVSLSVADGYPVAHDTDTEQRRRRVTHY